MVFTVNATDRDSGANGAVLYELVGESTLFHVSAGGVVTIADDLDYELQQTYQVAIYGHVRTCLISVERLRTRVV